MSFETEYLKIVRDALKDERFQHSLNVAEMCEKLAFKYFPENVDFQKKARFAGLLHDVRKEADYTIQEYEVFKCVEKESEISPPDGAELSSPPLWHGISAAYYLKNVIDTPLRICDWDILNSIRFHTVGRANMSALEKIVYLGDLVSAERNYDDVEKYRELAFSNLDLAMYSALKFQISKNIEKGGIISHYGVSAHNFELQLVDKDKIKLK